LIKEEDRGPRWFSEHLKKKKKKKKNKKKISSRLCRGLDSPASSFGHFFPPVNKQTFLSLCTNTKDRIVRPKTVSEKEKRRKKRKPERREKQFLFNFD
jgi:hypothetical protein